LQKKAAKLARKYDLNIQTHLAENHKEISSVKKLFPNSANYTDVYRKTGLLTKKTILAHCIHLDKNEIQMIKDHKARISHCPSSNRFLSNGLMPFRDYVEKKITIGLGTDIAGGYNLSMLDEMKEAIETSKTINFTNSDVFYEPITPKEAFYLATMGGAEALSIDKITGSLEKGKSADYITINYEEIDAEFEKIFPFPENILSKIIYCGNKSIIKNVFVQGREISDF